MPEGHNRSCVRTGSMVRCNLWSEPEFPPDRHHPALIPARREANAPLSGDALAQPTKQGHAMMISQPALIPQRHLAKPGAQISLRGGPRRRSGCARVGPSRPNPGSRRSRGRVIARGRRRGREPRPRGAGTCAGAPCHGRCRGASGRERAPRPRRRSAGHGTESRASLRCRSGGVRGAAKLDPLLDLTRTPAFWKLEPRLMRQRSTHIWKRDVLGMRRFCARGCRARFAPSRFGHGHRSFSAHSVVSDNHASHWSHRGDDRRHPVD